MKKHAILAGILSILIVLPACIQGSEIASPSSASEETPETKAAEPVSSLEEENEMPDLQIIIGDKTFSATLYDNAATRALIGRMPLTLQMSELNGNEKYDYLPDQLPADSRPVSNIRAGDFMLFGSDCLVLFYQSFSTSYNYTPLGSIGDVSGLADALGSESAQVIFQTV